MSKTTIIFLLLLPSFLFAQETKLVTRKHKDHTTKEVFYVLKSRKSVKQGNYQLLGYQNAVLINGYYNLGLKDSIWTEHYWGGTKMKSKGAYSSDKKIGVWEYYDFNGELEQQYDYSGSKLIFASNIELQKDKMFTVINGNDTIETKLDHGPIYIGGCALMLDPLKPVFPYDPKVRSFSGRVLISFVVDKNGKAVNHTVMKGVGHECDEEALRVVKLIPDNWLPGKLNGEAVDVLYVQSIGFEVN
jgi:hypothetical protein